MILSNNFTLQEYTKSQTATRLGLDNSPTGQHIKSAWVLFTLVIQEVRNQFGPTIITSGYRSKALNMRIGGSSKSQHCKGEAADIEVLGVSNALVAEWIRDNLEFDQLILEFHSKNEPNSGWIHVSYNPNGENRNQCLTSVIEDNKTVYKQGL